jgi:thiol-disulfide isomerase/thioredoxin
LNKLIKETPALAVDFWSPTCPPCMRIKPVFESFSKANEVRYYKWLIFIRMITLNLLLSIPSNVVTVVRPSRLLLSLNSISMSMAK